MGGGDLNLKKSWHPSTFSNLKKLWEAEQAHAQELQKLEQLKREKETEREKEEFRKLQEDVGIIPRQPERLDWLYSGPPVATDQTSQEQFLLGNKKHSLTPRQPSNPSEQPKAKREASEPRIHQNLREDPLFKIKKQNELLLKKHPQSASSDGVKKVSRTLKPNPKTR